MKVHNCKCCEVWGTPVPLFPHSCKSGDPSVVTVGTIASLKSVQLITNLLPAMYTIFALIICGAKMIIFQNRKLFDFVAKDCATAYQRVLCTKKIIPDPYWELFKLFCEKTWYCEQSSWLLCGTFIYTLKKERRTILDFEKHQRNSGNTFYNRAVKTFNL